MITLTINVYDEDRNLTFYEERKQPKRRSMGQIVNRAIRKYRQQYNTSGIDVEITRG